MKQTLYLAAKNQIGLTLDETYLQKEYEFTGNLEGGNTKSIHVFKNLYESKYLEEDHRSLTVIITN